MCGEANRWSGSKGRHSMPSVRSMASMLSMPGWRCRCCAIMRLFCEGWLWRGLLWQWRLRWQRLWQRWLVLLWRWRRWLPWAGTGRRDVACLRVALSLQHLLNSFQGSRRLCLTILPRSDRFWRQNCGFIWWQRWIRRSVALNLWVTQPLWSLLCSWQRLLQSDLPESSCLRSAWGLLCP